MLNKKSHSIMFHHFHNKIHKQVQGSLSASDFKDMIKWLNDNYSLLGAKEYTNKIQNRSLEDSDICLSFDDGLKCQYDIAFPILEELKIDAFFFIYSSIFDRFPDPMEIFRYFRNTCYKDIDEFYNEFLEIVERNNPKEFYKIYSTFKKIDYRGSLQFYSHNDKWFRYLRDQHLSKDDYDKIIYDMMLIKGYDIETETKKVLMTEKNLIDISIKGHTIGLHSHSHPSQISKLSKLEQKIEYKKNYDYLSKLLNKPINTMSHPCGDYNQDTLEVLKSLKIEIGFISTISANETSSLLLLPRQDQSIVLKNMCQ